MSHLPTGRDEPQTPVGFLAVQQEALVEWPNLLVRGAAHQQERARNPVRGSWTRVELGEPESGEPSRAERFGPVPCMRGTSAMGGQRLPGAIDGRDPEDPESSVGGEQFERVA